MPAPDVSVQILSAATPRTVATDTGTAYAAGVTQRGSSVKPSFLTSLQDFLQFCGARLASSVVYDWVETYFAEGGRQLYLSRVFGAGAVQASINLLDAGAGVSLVVKAGVLGDADPGTWANGAAGGLQVAVLVSGSQFQLQTSLNGVVVETSPLFSTQQDAINWANHPTLGSKYITVTLGATALIPVAAAATNLTGGTDGSAVDSTARQAALDRIPKHYGPGQICAPGVTATADQLAVIAHAVANNRFALLDGADTPTSATLTSAATALYAAPSNGRRWAQLLAPWELIPGLTSMSFRTVPPSARAAAQYARVDALGNPNQAAAGRYGTAQYVIDLSQPSWDLATRKTLNEAGITVSRRRYAGRVVTFGLRNLADQNLDTDWSQAPNVRTVMAYIAQAAAIGENYDFLQVDPFNHMLSAYRGDLISAAKSLFDVGALWGLGGPQEAFYVDVSDAINPPSQLAQGIVRSRTKLRTSPNAESMVVEIVKTPITQEV